MRVAVIGSGPTGLFLGVALARRGHDVVAVDRDPGPDPDGWARRGVMQFHHAHAVRFQVVDALLAEMPEAHDAWVAAGAEPITLTLPDGTAVRAGMRSRRETLERALRAVAAVEPGLELRRGHVDAVRTDGARATGIVVDGAGLAADLVIDASGRSGRVTRGLRPPPAVVGDTGIAYVDRQYRLRPGAGPGPMTNALAWQADPEGYQVIVFRHERGIFSVLVVRPVDEPDLVHLRETAAFEAACRAIPGLDDWTDPGRAEPITPVLPGGRLVSRYQEQPRVDGLVLVGDAVCTTTPMFGRGLATSILQARELLRRLDAGEVEGFGAWCDAHMRPWVTEHVRADEEWRRRWAGLGPDLTRPLPGEMIAAAAAVDPRIGAALGPFLSMTAGPDSLAAVEPLARAVYAGGWRPTPSPGPTRTELAALVRAAAAEPAPAS